MDPTHVRHKGHRGPGRDGPIGMYIDSTRHLQLDTDSRSNRYFRNAVERHWDPFDIDLSRDVENLLAFTEEEAAEAAE